MSFYGSKEQVDLEISQYSLLCQLTKVGKHQNLTCLEELLFLVEFTNGKEHKSMETSLLFPNGIHEGFARLILSCYISEARTIVEVVETFERIAYLTVKTSL